MDAFSQQLQDICLGHAEIAKAGIEAGERGMIPLRDRIAILEATLRGVRGMAETEVANGSKAWARAIEMIDGALA
jgi:hypothetical protein